MLAALALALAPFVPSQTFSAPHCAPRDVVETRHPGGALHERYAVNEEGERDGPYARFRPDGSKEVEAGYRAGELHGLYVAFAADGSQALRARYDKGARNGPWREWAGEVQTLDATYRNDALHGRWRQVSPDGARTVEAKYVRGALEGRYVEERADESWRREARYRRGALHGTATVEVDGKTVSERRWDAGTLVELDGIVPYPVLRETLFDELAEAERPGTAQKSDPHGQERADALARLKVYRALARLPWRHLDLDPELNEKCDAAAEICAANGILSHSPRQPSSMDVERFRLGYEGAQNSSLCRTNSLVEAIDLFMDDSAPENIAQVGHRRWCLDPAMGTLGLGAAGVWFSMWIMDASGPDGPERSEVLFPPAGYVPLDAFESHYAWSIQLLGEEDPPDVRKVVVEIQRLDAHYLPTGEPLVIDWKSVDRPALGGGPAVVFRPAGLVVSDGARYRARVSFDGGKTHRYVYIVEFVSRLEGGPEDAPDGAPGDEAGQSSLSTRLR
ncbi:MAG: hypothetical protein AAFP22_16130 [Planctomycetota bacterium]